MLLCDSSLLTTERTAATTSLALDYLIPDGAKKLTVIGSGQAAQAHLRYALEQWEWEEVVVYSPSINTKPEMKESISKISEKIVYAETAKDAVTDADVVMLCTSSGTPVIETQWLKSVVTVTSISTNVKNAHEIEPSELSKFKVFCDYRETAPVTAGEMKLAIEQGAWSKDDIVADLSELVSGKHKEPGEVNGQLFFRSTGLGLEDLAVAKSLLDAVS